MKKKSINTRYHALCTTMQPQNVDSIKKKIRLTLRPRPHPHTYQTLVLLLQKQTTDHTFTIQHTYNTNNREKSVHCNENLSNRNHNIGYK